MLETMNSKTVLHFWYETLMRQPEDTGITWFSEFNQFSLNYQQLEDQSNALALQFKERGISRAVEFNQTEIREPIIGVYCKQSSPLWMVASLAAWKVGAAVLLLDFTLKLEDLKYRIFNVNTSLVITDEPEWPETPETWMYFNIAISPILTSGFFYRDHQIDPYYLAYIAYTSGSTGKPKAVALNHAGIPGLINSHREIMRLNGIDKIAHISSLNFDPSWMNFFLLLSGTPCVLWNQTIEPQLSLFFNNYNITTSIFVPTTLASLKSSEFKTLSKILTTGEEASIALLNEWSILLAEPAEAGIEQIESVHRTASPQLGDSREIEFRKGLKNDKQLKAILKSHIPDTLLLGKAIDNGDCFFDSLAQIINAKNGTDVNNIKYLRILCHEFYLKNKQLVDKWNQSDFGGIDEGDNEYYMVQYTYQECEESFNGRAPIWGRTHIEGRMLCSKLNLDTICLLEILEDPDSHQPIIGYHKITKEGSKAIDEQEAKELLEQSIPSLVVEQKSLHFVPLLLTKNYHKQPLIRFNERSQKNREIFIGYGPTEHTVGSMLVRYTNGLPYYLGNPDADNIDNRQVFLWNQNDSPTVASDSNSLKEIFLAGLGLARGYIKEGQLDHKAMEGRFITTQNSNDASQTIRVYRTGDLAKLKEQKIKFKGRVDRQIKLRGRRVELSPIETALSTLLIEQFQLSGTQVHIIPVYTEINQQRIISELAAIIETDNINPGITQTMLNMLLAENKFGIENPKLWYWLPRHEIDELKLLQDSGKFNIRLCETIYNHQEDPLHERLRGALVRMSLGEVEYAEINLLPLEELILNHLREVLSIPETYPLQQLSTYSFEQLGGNSLFYVVLMERLEKEFDVSLQNRAIFQLDFGLIELATSISYQLVYRRCFKRLDAGSSSEKYLLCFPPVSGDVSNYRGVMGEDGKDWLDRNLNLSVMGFTMPEVLGDVENATPFFIQTLEFYKQRHLWCDLNVMAEYAFSEMRRLQPKGPYFLSGYSWGCHFAFAVAQHLTGKGYELGWLGLLDGIEPEFIARSLGKSYQVLDVDIWGNVITKIAERFNVAMTERPSMMDVKQDISPLEKLEEFMSSALQILEKTEVNDRGSAAAKSTLTKNKEKLIQYIRSCLYNLMATVSTQYKILKNNANNVTLFHTQAKPISSCMGTDATSWDKFFLVPISRVKVDCSHLAILKDRSFLKQFLQELQQRVQVQTANLWHVPSKNLNFTGRRELLSRIEQRLKQTTHNQPVVITACHGLGGIGKTQLVIEFIYQHLDTNFNVFWFSATTIGDIERCYLELAEKLDLGDEKKSSQETIEKVRRYLERQTNSLLIYDNAANYDILDPYLPRQSHCQVLVTSRNAIWPNAECEIEIDVFSIEDSRAYIQKVIGIRVGIDTDEDRDQLAEILGHLPLALAQACGYIKEMRISIKKYLEKYKTNKIKFLEEKRFPSIQDKHEPVYITWDITMEFVRERSPLAIKLLHFCAFINNENIPERLFMPLTGDVRQNQQGEDLDEAAALLCNFHLLSKNLVTNCFAIHLLVQEVIYLKLTEEEKQFYLNYVFSIIDKVYCYQEITLENLAVKRVLVPHLEFLLAKTKNSPEVQHIVIQIQTFLADAYSFRGDWEMAQKLLERTLEIQQAQVGFESLELVGTLNQLAKLALALGMPYKAREMLERAMSIIKLEYWAPMEEFLVLSGLGEVYLALGDLLKAQELFEHALRLAEKRFGKNHPALTQTKQALSNVYGELGNHIKQKAILESILASAIAIYGNHHPATASIFLDLGEAHAASGDEEQAYESIKKGLAIFKEQYGENHPEIAKMLTGLGRVYGEFGHPSEALEFFLQALQIMETHNKTDNPVIIPILLNLGNAYRDLMMFEKQITVLQRALSIKQDNSNSNIVGHANILIDLAEANITIESKEQAHILLEQCETLLGEFWLSKDLNVAMILDQLGVAFGRIGETERAIQLFLQSIRIQEEYFETDHSKLVPVLRNLEKAYCDVGESEKQIAILNRALSIEKDNPNFDYLIQVDILVSLAFAYYAEGEIQEVHCVLGEALRLLGNYRRSKNPRVAMILDGLGGIYGVLGDLDKSIQFFLGSIQILEACDGSEHPSLVPICLNLAEAYEYHNSCLAEQREVLIRALSIEEKNIAVSPQRLSTILSRLGEVYLQLHDKEAACKVFERSLEISKEIYGNNHPELTAKLMDLACTRAEREPEIAFEMAKQAYALFLQKVGMTVGHPYARFILKNVNLLQRLSEIPASERADYWNKIEPFVMTLEYSDYYCKEGFSVLSKLDFTLALETFKAALNLNNSPKGMFFRDLDLDSDNPDSLLRDIIMNNMESKVNPKVLSYYGLMLCYLQLQQITSEECNTKLAEFKKYVKRKSNAIYWRLLANVYQTFGLTESADEAEAMALSLTRIKGDSLSRKSIDQDAPAELPVGFSFRDTKGTYSPTMYKIPESDPNMESEVLSLLTDIDNRQNVMSPI